MRKTCEKHVEKRSMYWQCSTRDILLMFKIHILFLVVYIRLLTFNLNTYFFDFLFPLLIKTSPFFRYLGNFQPTLLLRPPLPPPPLLPFIRHSRLSFLFKCLTYFLLHDDFVGYAGADVTCKRVLHFFFCISN